MAKGERVPFPTALSFVPLFSLFFFLSPGFHLPVKSDFKAQISGGGFVLSQLNNPSSSKYTMLTHNVCTLSLLTSGLVSASLPPSFPLSSYKPRTGVRKESLSHIQVTELKGLVPQERGENKIPSHLYLFVLNYFLNFFTLGSF